MRTLSIAVPTFNRPTCLRECLTSVLTAISGHEDQVEFLVSNNGGTDATEEVVRAFQKTFKELKYFKSEVNVPADIHFVQVARRATGEYFWLIGDDDKIMPHSVGEILNKINQGHNLLLSNYSVWSADFLQMLRKSGLGLTQDLQSRDPNDVLHTFSLNMGYITSVIVRRSFIVDFTNEQLAPYAQYGFPLVYPIYASLAKDCRFQYIAKTLVCNRAGNIPSWPQERLWHHFFVTGSTVIFGALRNAGYSLRAVREAKRKVLIDHVLVSTIDIRLQNVRKSGLARMLISNYWTYPLFWFTCFPLLVTPFRVLNRIQRYLRKLPFVIKRLNGTLPAEG